MDPNRLQTLILLAPGAILAIALHEAMHGYVADRLGDPTARVQGRLTLNPFKHIDLFGTILVPALLYYTGGFLFGWAKPVPVNIFNLRQPKRDMALVAAAGPGANLVLGLCASAMLFALTPLVRADLSERILVTVIQPLVVLFALMLRFNIMLMFFNLIPIPPLDGGRILVGILPHRAALKVAAIEPFGFFLLIGLLIIDRNVPILSGTIFPAADVLFRLLLPGYLPQGV